MSTGFSFPYGLGSYLQESIRCLSSTREPYWCEYVVGLILSHGRSIVWNPTPAGRRERWLTDTRSGGPNEHLSPDDRFFALHPEDPYQGRGRTSARASEYEVAGNCDFDQPSLHVRVSGRIRHTGSHINDPQVKLEDRAEFSLGVERNSKVRSRTKIQRYQFFTTETLPSTTIFTRSREIPKTHTPSSQDGNT